MPRLFPATSEPMMELPWIVVSTSSTLRAAFTAALNSSGDSGGMMAISPSTRANTPMFGSPANVIVLSIL